MMKSTLLKLVPKRMVSCLFGKLADAEVNPEILRKVIGLYVRHYGVDMGEAKFSAEFYTTFNEFFTRQLARSARPIAEGENATVSPVDGRIAQLGEIDGTLVPQAKEIHYSIADLVGKKNAGKYADGKFATLYLSPADYHRIHSPVKGEVREVTYFPGNFWPVNEFGVANIGGLFAVNERVASFLRTPTGNEIAVVKVGALIVGRIRLEYTNINRRRYRGSSLNLRLNKPFAVEKGGLLGRFELGGSTVILLFQKGTFEFDEALKEGDRVLFGQSIGTSLP